MYGQMLGCTTPDRRSGSSPETVLVLVLILILLGYAADYRPAEVLGLLACVASVIGVWVHRGVWIRVA